MNDTRRISKALWCLTLVYHHTETPDQWLKRLMSDPALKLPTKYKRRPGKRR